MSLFTSGRKKVEEEDPGPEEPIDGSFMTMSYMIWGIFLCLDLPLQFFATVFSRESHLSLFSQAICVCFQCVLLAFYKPFTPMGVNYFIIIASFLNFLMAVSSGFVELFRRYTYSRQGEPFKHYLPSLDLICNIWVLGVLLWSLGLVVGKVMVSLLQDDDDEDEDDAVKGKSSGGEEGIEEKAPAEGGVYGFPPREADKLPSTGGGLGLKDDTRAALQSTTVDVQTTGVSERGPESPSSWPSELSPTSERRPPV